MTKQEALNWFRLRKKMCLSDRTQEAEDIAIECIASVIAQEPRVLTLDEIQAMPCDTPICVEEYYGSMYMDIYNGIDADSTDFITGNVHMECSYWIREEYGTLYRFWSAKPTEEQKKEVEWNGIQ